MPTANETYEQARSRGNTSFADEWGRVQKQLAAMTSGQRASQLGYSSLNPGEYVAAYDALGQARMRIGHQSDGTVATVYANGPPPPKPSDPIVSARQLAVYVQWDGTFTGGYARPGDVLRCDVHMSTTSGFTPDGTTIVGSIPFEGGILVGADNTTHYIRLVAVTTSDVASAATPELPVLPLPASQIAAGAVGASQLAADVALISRLISGDPNGARLEIEGRTGMAPGLRLYNALGYPTLELDASTGNVTMRGELRTDDAGERIVLAENGANDIRFYPGSGSRYARLYARGFTLSDGLEYGGLLMAGPTYNSHSSFIWTTPSTVSIYRGTPDGSQNVGGGVDVQDDSVVVGYYVSPNSTVRSRLACSATTAQLSFTTQTLGVDGAGLYYDSSGRGSLYSLTSGFFYSHTSARYAQFALAGMNWELNNMNFWNTTLGCSIYFAGSGVDIYNPANGAPLAIGASAFITKSARDTKTDIADLPFDEVEVIRNARPKMWERKADQRDEHGRYRKARKQFGPMADDLPEILQARTSRDDTLGIDLGSNLGVAWGAIGRHADQLDALTARLDALEKKR